MARQTFLQASPSKNEAKIHKMVKFKMWVEMVGKHVFPKMRENSSKCA
jgi:hypothetical protein